MVTPPPFVVLPSSPLSTHPQVRTVEAAHDALQQEFDQVQLELESSEAMVGELEQELEEERRKGEEEVGRCEALIVELQGQLEASEEQCRTEKAKVGESHLEESRWDCGGGGERVGRCYGEERI